MVTRTICSRQLWLFTMFIIFCTITLPTVLYPMKYCDVLWSIVCLPVRVRVSKTLCRNLTKVPVGPTKAVAQWRNCNFWAPGKHAVHSLMTVLIHNSGHFGPPLPFWAPGPPALPGAPMASYATAVARFCSDGDGMYFWFYRCHHFSKSVLPHVESRLIYAHLRRLL